MDDTTASLLAAASGDRAALARFVRDTQDDVWRFCAHLVDPASADDLTQEVYLRAIDAARRFRGESSARTWLLTIARRTAADEIRRRRRRRRLPAPVPQVEPDRAGELALYALLDELDHDRRVAFVLTQVIGLPYAQAADAAGVRIGTIRSRVARARADLLARLEPNEAHETAALNEPVPER